MKKNFFKKLSFVLAFAMIVSVLAPAAGVFAKAAPKLNAKTVYLYLDVIKKNAFDFNVAKTQKGWKYKWSSANKKVATVNSKNGLVTAIGAGKTQVSVTIKDKDGEEVNELTATVYVRDNIKDLVITNKPANDKVAVGTEVDFNRTYTTVAGKTKNTSGVTRWFVADKDGKAATGATIVAENGKFVATTAGTYTITARAFQSKAKYNSWLSDNAKYASYVTATATCTVTVASSMVKAEQVDLDTLKVTFDSEVTDADKKLSVVSLYDTAEMNQTIKKVTMSADKKVATVDMYVPFPEEKTVVVKYPEMKSVQFVAATSKIEDVTKIELTTTTAQVAKENERLYVKFLNKNGVDIAKADLYQRLTFKSSNANCSITTGTTPSIYMYKVGDTTTLEVTFNTYKYENGNPVGNLTATGVVTCVDKATDNNGMINAYTVKKATDTPDYKDVKHVVAAGDTDRKLFVQLKGTKVDGSDLIISNHNAETSADWKFTSSDINVMNVNPTTGDLYPYKEGTAVIVVTYKDKSVGSAQIEVKGKRELAIVEGLKENSFKLSNDDDVLDIKKLELSVKDQQNDNYSNYTLYVTKSSSNEGFDTFTGKTKAADSEKSILTFEGAGRKEGSYDYELKFEDNVTKKTQIYHVIIIVEKPSSDDVVHHYDVVLDKADRAYDTKLVSWDASEDVTISVFGYASNGVKNVRLDANSQGAGGLTVELKDNNGKVITTVSPSSVQAKDRVLPLVTVTGTTIEKREKGSYTISVVTGSSTRLCGSYFTVNDSQPAVVATLNKQYTDKVSKLDAVKDCFTFTYDGKDVTKDIVDDVNKSYSTEVTSGTSYQVNVKEVYYDQSFTVNGVSGTFRTKITLDKTIVYNYK